MIACTGCNLIKGEVLGTNENGEPYHSCCPDNDYREMTVLDWYTSEVLYGASQLVFGRFKHVDFLNFVQEVKAKADKILEEEMQANWNDAYADGMSKQNEYK